MESVKKILIDCSLLNITHNRNIVTLLVTLFVTLIVTLLVTMKQKKLKGSTVCLILLFFFFVFFSLLRLFEP